MIIDTVKKAAEPMEIQGCRGRAGYSSGRFQSRKNRAGGHTDTSCIIVIDCPYMHAPSHSRAAD
jgi:hypothetical protein